MFYTDKIIRNFLLILCVFIFLFLLGIRKNKLERLHNEFKQNKNYVVKSTFFLQ